MAKEISAPLDMIGRPLEVGDLIAYYSNMYEVVAITGTHSVKALIKPASKTSKPRIVFSRETALLPKNDALLWLLKKGEI